MTEPKNEFERGEWLMFKRITNVYFEKEYYFLGDDGTVYSRLSHKILQSKDEAYNEFVLILHSWEVDDEV
jgi:hypothetical protein